MPDSTRGAAGLRRRALVLPAKLLTLCLSLHVAFGPGRLLGDSADPAQTTASARRDVRILARQTLGRPRIDGRLDDPAWRSAQASDAFLQREPVEGGPPSERTVLRVLFNGDDLYFGIRCFDTQPDRVIASRMRRDGQLWEDDFVQIILDTYDDRRGGFYFATNALGARLDMHLSDEGRARNEAWNCVWTCRATRDSLGWSAEFAIPFDQLRYPDTVDAVWGINVGRMVRRKNEEVYLVPPPRAFGFDGPYRTSHLATLHGLRRLKPPSQVEMRPYVLPGTERDFEAVDATQQTFLDAGVDVKYGLSPSLTLDASYNTDFAQVESDQEQVNLTRFSLFFPEKRGFFLEGAGIFDFGERRERFGGRPPTLLFYSRRIGILEGHPVPVTYGAKLTGRAGPYSIGLLNVMTDPGTFVDEVEEDRFRTDSGQELDEEELDDLLAQGLTRPTIADTFVVDVIDTLEADRTLFSVLRVRRQILERSNLGIIAMDRSPGEEDADYNRAVGVDASLSFFGGATNLRGFVARSWSPDLEDDLSSAQGAGYAELSHEAGQTEASLSYLDVGEGFSPEIGFVPREDIRRVRGSVRTRPRPDIAWIRLFSMGPSFTYLVDHEGEVQTREVEASVWTNLEMGDWLGLGIRERYEWLDEAFEIHEDIEIPVGEYTFRQVYLRAFPSRSRRLSGGQLLECGQFFGGTRVRLSSELVWKASQRLTLETDYEINRVDLPQGDFLANRLSTRLTHTFSPDLFLRAFLQWNGERKLVGGNALINYQYRPGSDLYLVYSHAWDTEGEFRQMSRSLLLKASYFWKP